MEKRVPPVWRKLAMAGLLVAFAATVLGNAPPARAAERLVLCEEFTNPD